MVARTTEAWLVTLQKNLEEVEGDSEEAFESRRELAKLLVEKIVVSRSEEGRPKVGITYRFGPPAASVREVGAADGQNSEEEFKKAHGRGGELLRGHPTMSAYDVAVERSAERGR